MIYRMITAATHPGPSAVPTCQTSNAPQPLPRTMNDAMTPADPSSAKSQRRATRIARTLAVLACFVFVISVITAVVPQIFESIERPHFLAVEAISDAAGRIAIGIALTAALLTLASAIRLLHQVKDSMASLERFEN